MVYLGEAIKKAARVLGRLQIRTEELIETTPQSVLAAVLVMAHAVAG